jgi:hypothetical protein
MAPHIEQYVIIGLDEDRKLVHKWIPLPHTYHWTNVKLMYERLHVLTKSSPEEFREIADDLGGVGDDSDDGIKE